MRREWLDQEPNDKVHWWEIVLWYAAVAFVAWWIFA